MHSVRAKCGYLAGFYIQELQLFVARGSQILPGDRQNRVVLGVRCPEHTVRWAWVHCLYDCRTGRRLVCICVGYAERER